MWREAIGSRPLGGRAFDQDAWESKQSEMLIYPQESVTIWDCPDVFCPPLPPAIIASLKGRPHHFVHAPHYLMAANGFDPSSIGRVEADHESDHFQTPYGYQAAVRLCPIMMAVLEKMITDTEQMDQLEAHLSMMVAPASSSFQDVYHVSPVVSPEASLSTNRWMPPTYVQIPETAYTWPSAYQTSTFTGGEDYQTAVFQGLPNVQFPHHNNWGYANGPTATPTASVAHTDQTSFPNATDGSIYTGGSFSSGHSVGASFSSTFSSSFGDNQSFAGAYPPRAFHNSTPFDRIQELPRSPKSPENYFASSASSPATMPGAADSDAAHSSSEALPSIPSRPKRRASSKGKKTRKKLPENASRARHTRKRSSPPPPSKPAAIAKGRAIAPAPAPSATRRHSRNTRSNNSFLTATTSEQARSEAEAQLTHSEPRVARQAQLLPVLPAPPQRPALPAPSPASSPAPSPQETRPWSEKDQLLIHYRQAGMGYSQIQQLCGFKEAVSTLRGRYRTLTKPKEARVRKPAWTDHDVSFPFPSLTPPSHNLLSHKPSKLTKSHSSASSSKASAPSPPAAATSARLRSRGCTSPGTLRTTVATTLATRLAASGGTSCSPARWRRAKIRGVRFISSGRMPERRNDTVVKDEGCPCCFGRGRHYGVRKMEKDGRLRSHICLVLGTVLGSRYRLASHCWLVVRNTVLVRPVLIIHFLPFSASALLVVPRMMPLFAGIAIRRHTDPPQDLPHLSRIPPQRVPLSLALNQRRPRQNRPIQRQPAHLVPGLPLDGTALIYSRTDNHHIPRHGEVITYPRLSLRLSLRIINPYPPTSPSIQVQIPPRQVLSRRLSALEYLPRRPEGKLPRFPSSPNQSVGQNPPPITLLPKSLPHIAHVKHLQMPMRLARTRVFPRVKEDEQLPPFLCVCLDTRIRGFQIVLLQQISLSLELLGRKDDMLRHDGEFV